MSKVKASHNSAQDQHLMKHKLTRDNTLALIRSCGNEVYKVEKSEEGTLEPWKLRSRNF